MMLKKLSETAGIMAVAIKRGGETPEFGGEERWHPILEQSLRVSHVAGDVDLRITLAASTITVNTEKGFVVAVVIALGHPVQKSLLRLIRRQRVRAKRKGAAIPEGAAAQPTDADAEGLSQSSDVHADNGR